MSAHAEIAKLGVAGLIQRFRTGDISPVDAVAAYAERITTYNPSLNAFLNLRLAEANKEAAQSEARWRAGAPLSPVDGVPYGAKANIAVKGLPWHGGIAAYVDRIADDDAVCVKNLNQSGAIVLGALNMHEGALGATTNNPHFGACHNPWGDGLTPGGSSGGSGAAVAAGLCAFALGTDTMGSIRIPSAYCGVAGHKPSYGLVPAGGLVDLSPTLDHAGPHARAASDLVLVMPALTGRALAPSSEKLHIGVANWSDAVDVAPQVQAAFDAAVQTLGDMFSMTPVDLSSFDFGALRRKGLLVSEVEGYAAHEEMLARKADGFSNEFRSMLEWGARQPTEKINDAYTVLRKAGEIFAALFKDVDVIVAPTAPQGPFKFSDPVPANQADFTALANFSGLPAVAVPSSLDGAPPASIQFVAAKGMDHNALEAASAFETARGQAPTPPGYF